MVIRFKTAFVVLAFTSLQRAKAEPVGTETHPHVAVHCSTRTVANHQGPNAFLLIRTLRPPHGGAIEGAKIVANIEAAGSRIHLSGNAWNLVRADQTFAPQNETRLNFVRNTAGPLGASSFTADARLERLELRPAGDAMAARVFIRTADEGNGVERVLEFSGCITSL